MGNPTFIAVVLAVGVMSAATGAWANALEMAPVGATWVTKCTGDNPAERTWKVVKNDGTNYRIEASDGSYVEGPLWGRAIGFNTENEITGGNGKFSAELDGDGLKKVGDLEIGKSITGYVQQTGRNGTFQHRHDVTIKERAERDTPFGKVEAILIVDKYGNNFWNATQTVWYSPELKAPISNDFESNRGQKSSCQLMTRPQ